MVRRIDCERNNAHCLTIKLLCSPNLAKERVMRKTKIAFVMLLGGVFFSTFVFAEADLSGVRIGMNKEELNAAHPGLNCGDICYYSDSLQSRHARTLETLAGAHVESWRFVFSADNKLVSGYAKLGASSGPEVTSALVEKLGKPTAEETEEFRTADGFRGPKKITSWIDGDTVITVAYPSGRLTDMMVEIYSKNQRDAEIEAVKAKSK
jgi:hypothetical protein